MSNIEKTARKSISARRIMILCLLAPFFIGIVGAILMLISHGMLLTALLVTLFTSPLWLVWLLYVRWTRTWVVDIIPLEGNRLLFRCYRDHEWTIDRSQIMRIGKSLDYYVFFLNDHRKLWFYRRHGFGWFKVREHPVVNQIYFPYTEFY